VSSGPALTISSGTIPTEGAPSLRFLQGWARCCFPVMAKAKNWATASRAQFLEKRSLESSEEGLCDQPEDWAAEQPSASRNGRRGTSRNRVRIRLSQVFPPNPCHPEERAKRSEGPYDRVHPRWSRQGPPKTPAAGCPISRGAASSAALNPILNRAAHSRLLLP
jgi:hypothetical protein